MIRTRKLVHILVGIVFGFIYFFVEREIYIWVVFLSALASLVVHAWKDRVVFLEKLYKEGEIGGGGFTSMLLSLLLGAIMLSPREFAALLVLLTFGDGMAGYWGSLGRIKLPWSSKTLEGMLGFMLFSLPLLLIFPEKKAALLILSATVVESVDMWEDNLALAILVGLVSRYGGGL